VASIEDKMREARLRWFGHIRRRRRDALVKVVRRWNVRIIEGVEVGRRRVGAKLLDMI